MGLDEALLTLIKTYGGSKETIIRITGDEVTVTTTHDRGVMTDTLKATVAKERVKHADISARLQGTS